MKMPLVKYNKGELVMGRWPGSSLYYEVKVLDYDVTAQLYTVIYKDGTELELREQDIKSVAGFQTRSRSRSRSPSRRRSRSRSPARTTRRTSSSPARTTRRTSSSPARTTRRSSSRTAAAMAAAAITESIPSSHRDAKLKDTLEVRLSPLETMENNKHQTAEDNKTPATGTESKEEVEAEKRQSRYNLRRRKEEADGRSAEDKTAQELRQVQEKDATFSAVAAASPAPQLDFGGKIGAYFWLLFLPAWVLFLILQVNLADPSLANIPPTLPALGTLWDGQALAFVVLWILFQALLYLLPVGKLSDGMPLKSGQRLKYRTNGFLALVLSCAGTAAAAYQGVDFTYIHSHFLQLAVASFIVSTLLSVYLYVRSLSATPADLALGGSSGNVVYDFFKGRELNPRLKGFDLKFFCEMRPGLIGWCLINFAMALAEMKQQQLDTPSSSMILVNLFQLLYVLDGLWNEEAILTTMDLMHDGFGFMLAFGDLVWVPFTYTLQAYYLVSHPSPLSPPALAAIVTLKAIGFYIFRKSNSEKNAFRRNPADPNLAHLKTIPTATGKSLLVSGWWGVVRHPNYVGDLLMALAWSLPCGFNHLLPWYYMIYFIILLVHRDSRDMSECGRKYGSAWEEYCRTVRYRLIPRVY